MTKHPLRFCALLTATSLFVAPASALQATSDQAREISESLQRYIGKQDAAAPALTVTPRGDSYDIAYNVSAALTPLASFLTIDSPRFSLTATPQPDGLWKVTSDNLPKLTVHIGAMTETIAYSGFKYEGLFDPRMLAMKTYSATVEKLSVNAVSPQSTISTVDAGQTASGQSSARASGDLDVKSVANAKAYAIDLVGHRPAKEGQPAGPDFTFKGNVAEFATHSSMDGLRWRQMLDLWAFAVAHPSQAAAAAAQADLKEKLRAASSLFEKVEAAADIADIDAQTLIGRFGAKSTKVSVFANGLVDHAAMAESFQLSGVALPPGVMPAWATGLAPTDVSFGFRVEGLNLAAAAKEAIEVFDLNAPKPISDADGSRIAALAAPDGKFKLILPPGRVTSALADISFEASADIAMPRGASGKARVSAKGVEAILEKLKAGMATDKNLAGAFGGLSLAKGLGKPGPDGALVWDMEFDSEGKFIVNGAPLGKGR